MAFAGLKKQINKANQYVTEKMGGAEGTKLDLDFQEMERKTDVTYELVEELQVKTKEYLQPNPTARAKMAAVKGISKLSGQAKSNTYPQPEGILADCMLMYGKKLGEDSIFGTSMVEFGESLRQMADCKYSLDDNVKQNMLEPLHHLQTKDLKEVMHHRKKLQGRRLDYDCKRRRQAKGSQITDDEIRSAEEKFAESLHLAQMGMFNLLENDVEQVAQLLSFAEGVLEYHQQSTEILKILVETLEAKKDEAMCRPKHEFSPKTLADLNIESMSSTENGGVSNNNLNRVQNSHHQLYSSHQNLSNYNNNNRLNNNNSNGNNFKRSQIYGSQQSLSTMSNQSSNNSITSKNYFAKPNSLNLASSNNHNSNANNNNTISEGNDWLNAWNSPPNKLATTRQQQQQQQQHCSHTNSSSSYNNNNNISKQSNAHISNDPWSASPLPSPMRSPARTPMPKPSGPCCSALYDFEAENPGELGFKENDVIQLINRVDDNWYEGSINGRTGYFPQSYVQIVVPFPN